MGGRHSRARAPAAAPASPRTACRALLHELSAYLDGELPAARRRIVERHVRQCACCHWVDCRMRWAVTLCRDAADRPLPPAVRARARRRVAALLAQQR